MGAVKSDIEIARSAKMQPIQDILAKINVPNKIEAFSPIGPHIAKINLDYLDNDSQAKTHLQWVVNNNETWKNIFWNNTKIQDYIAQNTNNNISQTPNLWSTGAVMYFWINRPVDIRITEFRKSDFDQYGELIPIDKNEFTLSASGTGFLQNNGTLSTNITGWEFNFDFVNRNYAIFLKNQDSNVAIYDLYFQNGSAEKIISLPIRDDIANVFSYLWYNIMINSSGRYIYKMQEMFTDK